MPRTEIRSEQIRDGDVRKDDIDTTTTGQALITKVIAGTGISLSSTGVDAGTGDVTITATGSSPTIVIGGFDTESKNVNGLAASGTTIYAQSADASFPGMVTTAAQTFEGAKTFNVSPILSSVTVSQPLKVDGSGQVVSGLIDLTTEVTGVLPPANTNFPEDTIQTTDATPTTIQTIALAVDEIKTFQAMVNAKGPSGKHYWATITGGVRRDGSNTAVIVGTPVIIEDEDGGALYVASASVSGNNLLIQVQGEASETVDWLCRTIKT